MEEPTTNPSGSNPASPSSTYSDTDRSEVNPPPWRAPAVLASRPSAASGSQLEVFWPCGFENSGIVGLPAVVDPQPTTAPLFSRASGGQGLAPRLRVTRSAPLTGRRQRARGPVSRGRGKALPGGSTAIPPLT